MANIDVGFTQYRPYATDHSWLIGVATEENIALRYKLCPIAANTHDTWLTMHHRSAQHLHALIARAGLACKGCSISVGAQHTQRHQIGELCWCSGLLLNDLQSPLLCQQLRVNHIDMCIGDRFEQAFDKCRLQGAQIIAGNFTATRELDLAEWPRLQLRV